MRSPHRATLRYHGGKNALASWYVSLMPAHKTYVELCCGAASVFMLKPRCYAEVLNDRDDGIVEFLGVLRDPKLSKRLMRQLRLTPYARTEYVNAREPVIGSGPDDVVERARRLVVRSFQGFGTGSMQVKGESQIAAQTGFRSTTRREGSIPSHDWVSYPAYIPVFRDRLLGAVIENQTAVECVTRHDSQDTLFYADPPYPFSTRSNLSAGRPRQGYRFEMTDDDHRELAASLRAASGMVMISGYGCPLYDEELYPDWTRLEKPTHGDGGAPRTEVVWINDAMASRDGLFSGAFLDGANQNGKELCYA